MNQSSSHLMQYCDPVGSITSIKAKVGQEITNVHTEAAHTEHIICISGFSFHSLMKFMKAVGIKFAHECWQFNYLHIMRTEAPAH